MIKKILIAGLILFFTASANAAEASEYKLELVSNGLKLPWAIAFLPSGEFLVSELEGSLHLVSKNGQVSAPIKGVPPVYYAGQGGLMDVVLHPNYRRNRLVYLSLSVGDDAANTLRVVRGKFDGKRLSNLKTIFEGAPRRDTPVHYGARMVFLSDNSLLINVGDGFNYREEAQNPFTHLGSIVRVGDDGSIPRNNPFYNSEAGLAEIYSVGHRNAQGIVYDAKTRRVFQTEHGARGGDELNLISAGKNYGWPAITHGLDYNFARISPYTQLAGMEQPLVHWSPSIAPSGMTLYRGRTFPQWDGDIFVASLTYNKIVRVDMDGRRVRGQSDMFTEIGERLRDIRTAPDGSIYILSEGSDTDPRGKIWRVVPK